MPNSPQLVSEIEEISTSVNKAFCKFKNGSYVKVVTASDNARGNRKAKYYEEVDIEID